MSFFHENFEDFLAGFFKRIDHALFFNVQIVVHNERGYGNGKTTHGGDEGCPDAAGQQARARELSALGDLVIVLEGLHEAENRAQ